MGRDVERLTGEILNQIVPGLRQARSALADASIAASDTPPGGSQTLDADAMQDALPPPPSLPSVDDEDARELRFIIHSVRGGRRRRDPGPALAVAEEARVRGDVGLAAAEASARVAGHGGLWLAARRAELLSSPFPIPVKSPGLSHYTDKIRRQSTNEVAERQAPPK